LLDESSSYRFNSSINPLVDWPQIMLSKENWYDYIQWFEVKWEWNNFIVWECRSWESLTKTYFNWEFLNYNELYKFDIPLNKLCIQFEKSLFNDNYINKIEYWLFTDYYEDREICEIPETWEVFIDWEEYTGSWTALDIAQHWLDSHTYSSTEILTNFSYWSSIWYLEIWTINSPNETDWACDMFNSNMNFMYYSNGSVWFNFEFDSLDIPVSEYINLQWFFQSVVWVISWPINTIIAFIWIITPFWTEPKTYCLFWSVVEYENHKFFIDTEYYNQFTIIDYLILYWYYFGLFKLIRKHQTDKKKKEEF
jgi:hypothetical protein